MEPYVDMHVNDLAEFVFLKNVNDAKLVLSLGGIEDTKDLFYFCLDMFCKGLVMLFGKDGKVHVQDLTLDQFHTIKTKMYNASIDVVLNLHEDIADSDEEESVVDNEHLPCYINIGHIESLPNNLNIKEYKFVLRASSMVYEVTFDIIHNP
jgi:hypothetical protein